MQSPQVIARKPAGGGEPRAVGVGRPHTVRIDRPTDSKHQRDAEQRNDGQRVDGSPGNGQLASPPHTQHENRERNQVDDARRGLHEQPDGAGRQRGDVPAPLSRLMPAKAPEDEGERAGCCHVFDQRHTADKEAEWAEQECRQTCQSCCLTGKGDQQAPDEQRRDREADQSRETHGRVRRDSKMHDEAGGRLEQRELDRKEERRPEDRHLGPEKVDPLLVEEKRRVRGRRLAERLSLEEGLAERGDVDHERQRQEPQGHYDGVGTGDDAPELGQAPSGRRQFAVDP